MPKEDGPGYQDRPFLNGPSAESFGVFSPDGNWVAYCSNSSGRDEIYVSKFPENTVVRQISRNGGTQVRWSRDGSEIFYVEGQTLMSVAVSLESGLSVGSPEVLFSNPSLFSLWAWPTYDANGDGKKFLLVESVSNSPTKTHVVQNWLAEFRDRQ
jgi:Tol biopolymer transport system component